MHNVFNFNGQSFKKKSGCILNSSFKDIAKYDNWFVEVDSRFQPEKFFHTLESEINKVLSILNINYFTAYTSRYKNKFFLNICFISFKDSTKLLKIILKKWKPE